MRLRKKKIIYIYIIAIIATVVFTLWQLNETHVPYSTTVRFLRVPTGAISTSNSEPAAKKSRRKSNHTISYSQEFNDKQAVQFAVAEAKGIAPISDYKSAFAVRLPVSLVESNSAFVVDTLCHSLPYLQTDALDVLNEIGTRFCDSVNNVASTNSRIIVTSLLRTDGSVAKLRRRNRNAVENSTHRYGRTFDITYNKFAMDDTTAPINYQQQKQILASILKKLRADSLIYVKYERKQGCFHITVR